jgi:hypothetical protein
MLGMYVELVLLRMLLNLEKNSYYSPQVFFDLIYPLNNIICFNLTLNKINLFIYPCTSEVLS